VTASLDNSCGGT